MLEQRCGTTAILGESNVGKSTLVNQIVGSKVSIVTPKVQTTRRQILGIAIHNNAQLLLVDTPGVFTPKKHLEKIMVQSAYDAIQDADCTLLLIDASKKNFTQSYQILEKLNSKRSVILVLNKIDLVTPEKLLTIAQEFSSYKNITHTFMISALKNNGVDDLIKLLCDEVPLGPWLYPEDQITNMPLRLWAAEITREQLVLQLRNELPYETFVETESWENFENGSVKINQAIIVAKSGQKSIILGHKGQQIKKISLAARTQIAYHLNQPVHLYLFVKVKEKWMEKNNFLQEAGIISPI